MRIHASSILTCVILVMATCLLTGCGTLLYGEKAATFVVESRPPGANIVVNGRLVGETPLSVTLDREVNLHQVVLRMEGFEPHTCLVTARYNKKAALLNAIPAVLSVFSGLLGITGITVVGPALASASVVAWGVDYFTDNHKMYPSDACSVDMLEIQQ